MEKRRQLLRVKSLLKTDGGFNPFPKYQLFSMRIIGNYKLMDVHIRAEDLVHMVLVPYEIYLAQGRGSMELNQDISLRQHASLHAVNQLVNRLMLVTQSQQTYQDQVFITAILRKLGLRDAKEFVVILRKYMDAGDKENELLRLYQENRSMISQVKKEISKRQTKKSSHEGLAETVFQRFGTPGVSRELYKLFSIRPEAVRGPNQEALRFMEYMGQADRISLLHIKKSLVPVKTLAAAGSVNPYEWESTQKEEGEREGLLSHFAAAALLHLLGNLGIYQRENGLQGSGHMQWMDLNEAICGGGDTMAERIFLHHRNIRKTDMEIQRGIMDAVLEGFKKEIKILTGIREIALRKKNDRPGFIERRKGKRLIKQLEKLNFTYLKQMTEEYEDRERKRKSGWKYIEEDIRKYVFYADTQYLKVQWERPDIRMVLEIANARNTETTQKNGVMKQAVMDKTVSMQAYRQEQDFKLLDEMVRNKVKGQLDTLSDKVYGKLEKRLTDEQRRRGM